MNKELRLKILYQQAIIEVEHLGIEHGNIVEVTINNRAKNRFGQCRKRNGVYSINISSFILTDKSSDKAIKNTIIHEILHTCKNCMNHGKEWQRLADKVNRAYGYDISRCSTYESFNLSYENIKDYKYFFKCKGCGQEIKRTRKSDFVTNTNKYSCGRCGNKFERVL